MKSNIIVVGLDYTFAGQICLNIANKFDMFFLDVKDLIEYNLINSKNVEKLCGVEYLKQEQKTIAISAKNYENTVINFPYSLFLDNDIAGEVTVNSLVVFLKMEKQVLEQINTTKSEQNNLTTEIIVADELNKLISKKSDIVVSVDNSDLNFNVEKIIQTMKKHFS